MELVVEVNERLVRPQPGIDLGGTVFMMTPPVNSEYWWFRVRVSDKQAIQEDEVCKDWADWAWGRIHELDDQVMRAARCEHAPLLREAAEMLNTLASLYSPMRKEQRDLITRLKLVAERADRGLAERTLAQEDYGDR